MTRLLVLGATSAIAGAVAERYAARGARLYLVGRDETRLQALVARMTGLGSSDARGAVADLAEPATHAAMLREAWSAFGGFDRVLIAYGMLPDEEASRHDWRRVQEAFAVNLVSVVALLDRLVELAPGPAMHVVVIGSAGADRGRDRVAVYAAAKAGVERYVEALRQRCWPHGPRIGLVKPGWVRTPMTAHLRPGPLMVSPEQVATGIEAALERGTPTAYLPLRWRAIAFVIRAIPERIFRRLRF